MSSARDGRICVTPVQLFVRCFAEKSGDQWQAFSLEFGLAAQADTLDEVRAKLDVMISCYFEDALVGEDAKHAELLLNRKSTLAVWCKYHLYYVLGRLRKQTSDRTKLFSETLPLAPVPCPI